MKINIVRLCALTILALLVAEANTIAQDAAAPARSDSATLEGVNVTGEALSETLRQETPVGPNRQPEWTTQPNFTTSRVYVRPPGQVELVQFWTPEFARNGEVSHGFREEIEIGLPYRFQLDLYGNWEITQSRDARATGGSVELRYALADWGKIPLNPALYGEWTFNRNAADVLELKLLLGQVFFAKWHYAANITFEQQMGDERETAWQVSQALSYPLIDRKLNAGVEMLWERATEKDLRGDPTNAFAIGPSLNVRPTGNTFINVAPLFGVTNDAPHAQVFVTFGYRFGGPSESGVTAPASMQAR